ncbi:FUSC family protein [Pseudoclavibacter chungangensis]|uniref:FUSC family protein n=1 Tax=Pseudoclavibacter chungangensis TaxID=587635 RepID=A0A7J5C0C1_9MICO|nr:FUSC family protein [Pseudoclavibacter chungangensis]KAB1660337.1 FUSC family protein [Pseudoclavibacter chungangensis]NYJ65694.1 uncharacterized membrane protein YgaE (UPF0421/DUF939 family) [Pseudoclavibacter chungangensis]
MAGLARFDLGESIRRVADSSPAILQIAIASLAAYSIAHYPLGHPTPFLAVTVCITALGFARDARPRRVVESALGIVFGVVLANAALVVIGRGVWQLAIVLVLSMVIARFIHPGTGFAAAATVQAALVSLIPLAPGVPEYSRIIDAFIGGAVAILSTALVPRDARRMVLVETRALLESVERALTDLVDGLRLGDDEPARLALRELRGTQTILDRWHSALESATAIARISPFLRGQRASLADNADLHAMLDLSVRNLRVLARRSWSLAADGVERPHLADLLADIESGVRELALGLDRPGMRARARQTFVLAAVRCSPSALPADAAVGEVMIVMQCRPLLVDLLRAAGADEADARACLPAVA